MRAWVRVGPRVWVRVRLTLPGEAATWWSRARRESRGSEGGGGSSGAARREGARPEGCSGVGASRSASSALAESEPSQPVEASLSALKVVERRSLGLELVGLKVRVRVMT